MLAGKAPNGLDQTIALNGYLIDRFNIWIAALNAALRSATKSIKSIHHSIVILTPSMHPMAF